MFAKRCTSDGTAVFGAQWPLDHRPEEDAAIVPSINPAHAPAIDAISQGHTLKEAQELGSTHGWQCRVA
jgi:hypothetical protein